MLTTEEKRKFVKRYGEFIYISKTWQRHIGELRLAVLPSGVQYSEEPVAHSVHTDKLAEYMARLDEMSEQYEGALDAAFEIRRAIDKLEKPTHRLVLTMRFCEGLRLGVVAKGMGYSTKYVLEIIHDAIEELEIDEEVFRKSEDLQEA